MRLIGDVHGKFARYREIIRGCPASVQVGDMGVGFKRFNGEEYVWSSNPPFDAMSEGEHRFIRGNHDNLEACSRHPFWIPDGAVFDGVMFVGGGTSIDRAYRSEGIDWWGDEELSYSDLATIADIYARSRPRVMITHECPEVIAEVVLARFNRTKFEDGSRTRQAFQAMLEEHQPELWVFGHWHVSFNRVVAGTRFRCLNELEFVDIDL